LAQGVDDYRDWTAPEVSRVEPDRISSERESLQQWLDFHRATLLMKCTGLSADQLKQRSVPPSRLSLLGLKFPYDPDSVGLDFEDIDDADAAANLAAFNEECAACDAAVHTKSLDDVVPSRGDNPERTRDIRWIYVHMIEEYARHNGHADIIREAIDGATGD
jgi:hypothetical protein